MAFDGIFMDPLPKISYIAIENTPFSSLIYLFKTVIFHGYVSLPEGAPIAE